MTMPRADLYDFSMLSAVLSYNKRTGVLRWKHRVGSPNFNANHAGKVAGYLHKKTGYLRVRVSGVTLQHHRVCFVLGSKENIPADTLVDHRDRNKTNSRFKNLRAASSAQNVWNRSGDCDRLTDLPKNVVYRYGRYYAHFYANGKRIYVGGFVDLDAAKRALRSARSEHHGQFARHN